ncbi:hypothetical protein [Streptomyces sasae]|uniref:hypothetical protein n=1 Tax=Streptomyces sasae TaxID=1266772 RepID=UPI00292DB827|nr:hypothetical protein [Streptomyces sasae]
MADSFQLDQIPHGFAFTETGALIHYKHTIILTVPPPNAGPWGDCWLSFGCAWADTKLGVSIYTGSSWGGVSPRNVPDNGNLCRSESHRCWSSRVSVLVDDAAQYSGAQ